MESKINMKNENEFERLLDLSEFELDYANLNKYLADLTKLAAKISGKKVSLVNLIDNHTQWSVSAFGIDIKQMSREDAVCNHTIREEQDLEVLDLKSDERFENKFYVKDGPKLKYYYGVPLETDNGYNIGALCVMDTEAKDLSAEKKEMLKLIANEVVSRLKALKYIQKLRNKVDDMEETKRKLSHDLRGPISGIIGLADIIEKQGKDSKIEEIMELISLIKKGGQSVLELAEEILNHSAQKDAEPDKSGDVTCGEFCRNLKELYGPQATAKNVTLNIDSDTESKELQFPKAKAIQITGNLISNSIKFTDENGEVKVNLSITEDSEEKKLLKITVLDTGIGMSDDEIKNILDQNKTSKEGTKGEKGYGFGLTLVQHLVLKNEGKIDVESEENAGTTFMIKIPL